MDIFPPPYCDVTVCCCVPVIPIWANYRLSGNGAATPSGWVREGTTGVQNNGETPGEEKNLSARNHFNLERLGCCI